MNLSQILEKPLIETDSEQAFEKSAERGTAPTLVPKKKM
jgi:hypothetical protein